MGEPWDFLAFSAVFCAVLGYGLWKDGFFRDACALHRRLGGPPD